MIKYYYEVWREFKDFGGSEKEMLYITENKEIAKDICRRGNNENCVHYNPNIKFSYEATAYESSEDNSLDVAECSTEEAFEWGNHKCDGVKMHPQYAGTKLLNNSVMQSPTTTCTDLKEATKIFKKEPKKVAISASPCNNCEAKIDADSAQDYCNECRSNNYSHHFTDFVDNNDGKIQRLANEISALVSLVKELGFKEFVTNQWNEYKGYNYNGFSMNEEATDEQIERFNILKYLLPTKETEE